MPGLKQHIIGLCGHANVGKDTVADLLVTHAGFMKLSWADTLRGEVATGFDIPLALLTTRETKELPSSQLALRRGPLALVGAVILAHGLDETFGSIDDFLDAPRSPRQILQWWGTEYRRREDPDYWVKRLASVIHYRMTQLRERNFVITDCRFANEVAKVRELGGELWQVSRPNTGPASAHVSVTDGTEFNPEQAISNAGSIPELQAAVLGKYWARDAGLNRVTVEIA